MPGRRTLPTVGGASLDGVSDTLTTTPVIEPDLADTDEGDHDRFAHYVRKSDIVRANVEGVPVQALCGKKWVPNRNPDRYPVCPTCKEIFETLKALGR